jgi:hypothetical protein
MMNFGNESSTTIRIDDSSSHHLLVHSNYELWLWLWLWQWQLVVIRLMQSTEAVGYQSRRSQVPPIRCLSFSNCADSTATHLSATHNMCCTKYA